MWRKLALLASLAIGAAAQTIDVTSGPWSATLDGTWRWHPGDDMQWAAPSFDDSNWPSLRVPGPLPPNRQYWFRIHVETGNMSDPGLLLGPIAYAYDIYWDDQRIGHFGDLTSGRWCVPRLQTFHVPRELASPGDHAIAVRVGQIGTNFGTRGASLNPGDSRVGDFATLRDVESAHMSSEVQHGIFEVLIAFGLAFAGLYFLLLPPSVSEGAAFRWLGITLLGRALTVLCEFYANNGPLNMPGSVLITLTWTFIFVHVLGSTEFPYALFRRHAPLAVRVLECFLALLLVPSWPVSYAALFVRFNTFSIPSIVSIALAGAELRRRTPDAGLNLFLFAVMATANLLGTLAVYPIRTSVTIDIAGMRLYIWEIAYLVWAPAIAVQIHKTNLRFRDERERLRGEMQAARHVQELLVPSQSARVPGFEIDTSYYSATEVGGDFFQLFPAPNGSLLVVVGDVSGKGMKAALLVSVIVGVLQNRKSDQPAEVLRELNAVLLERSEGGFTTCCCALFSTEGGTLTIANAGHLAPYRNGLEFETSPGLPLGIVREATWEEMQIELQPNDRMLWISDGVVEARNGKRDLLGFERAQALATQSASEIARAAQQFGQDDDITVISVTRQPVAAYVA